ncbi:MAG: LLM class flavin-dependent oxidoreductase [Microbacterium sp.]|uniref:LLM class flavin-dependent oxidoreductase n=1 Tax=Microbacterium sp. TaxID=51671 RepID=UPI0039E71B63
MILGLNVLGVGQRPAAWQAEQLAPTAFIDRDHWVRVAREAERGLLDALFLADQPWLADPSGRPAGALEPTVLLSAVAAHTERLGLVATLSSTYNDPAELAARILTLDHLSGGRAGWNVVTTASPDVGANFGITAGVDRDSRYRRAHEVVTAVERLWADAGSGRLSLPPSPQGRPALVQAGGSPEGRRLAGEHADAVFTAEMTLDAALEHYRVVKDHARRIGRDPHTVKVLPGFALVIASTEREAADRFDEWEARGPADYTLARLSGILGVDASVFDLDLPLPPEIREVPDDPATFGASLSFRATTVRFARTHGLTVRQLLRAYGGYGHPIIIGTPERVAGTLADWFLAGAADGFNLMPDVLPEGLTTLVDEVLPLLRARGLFRSEYEAATLRGRLGGLTP